MDQRVASKHKNESGASMVKITTDVRFDITPVDEWPEDKQADLTTDLVSYVERELTTDVERALLFIEIAETKKLWRFIGKDSMAGLFERCDLTLEAIEQYRRGVQLLRDKGYAGAITKEQARKAAVEDARANPLRDVGPPTKEEKNNLGNSNNTVGNTNEYLLRRLARDQPELLNKVESGELSINQAAITAGIRKKPSQEEIAVKAFRKADDKLNALKQMIESLAECERRIVMEWLSK